ncbi:unnamed protein product [Durusdinium trenchii]|uniref:Pentatricopeptide repeat-containing protein n=1 Tax=Durusdinium trenchii TaxID=1381693 RepID=A0ABP0MI99_9DINO
MQGRGGHCQVTDKVGYDGICCSGLKRPVNVCKDVVRQANCIAYNAAMSACEKAGQWPFALELFGEVSSLRVQLDICTCGAAISACEKGERWEKAIFILQRESLMKSSLIGYNAAISACGNKRQWAQSFHLFLEVQDIVPRLSEVTFSAMISALDVGHPSNLWELCLWILHMSGQSMSINLITYNTALTACANAGKWREALQLLSDMAKVRVHFDEVTFDSTLRSCITGNRAAEAREFINLLRTFALATFEPRDRRL